jgi:predicted nucleotidyltransferase
MQEKELKIVEQFKQLVLQRVKVHEVRVFGSRARGDAAIDSDLDVLVVVDHLDHDTEKYISDCAWEAGFPEDIIIMPIAVTLDTLKNHPFVNRCSSARFIARVFSYERRKSHAAHRTSMRSSQRRWIL